MAVKAKPIRVKPVEATVISDINIIRQVIAEVRRTPTPERMAELREENKVFESIIRNSNG